MPRIELITSNFERRKVSINLKFHQYIQYIHTHIHTHTHSHTYTLTHTYFNIHGKVHNEYHSGKGTKIYGGGLKYIKILVTK